MANHTACNTDARSNRLPANINNILNEGITSKRSDAIYLETDLNSIFCLAKFDNNLNPKIKNKIKTC